MATMKAALHDGKSTMIVTDVRRPEAGPRDALIRIRAVGVCGSGPAELRREHDRGGVSGWTRDHRRDR